MGNEEVDPEMFSLMQAIGMENEPQPSLTYHSSERCTIQGKQKPVGLVSPSPGGREEMVGVAAVVKLAEIRQRMGDEGFRRAAAGKLT